MREMILVFVGIYLIFKGHPFCGFAVLIFMNC